MYKNSHDEMKKEMQHFTKEAEKHTDNRQRTDVYVKIYYGNRRTKKILRINLQYRYYVG